MTLPLVVTTTIVDNLVSGILIDDEKSYDQLYIEIFKKLGLHDQDLKSYEGGSLLAFNESSTLLYGTIELLISFT